MGLPLLPDLMFFLFAAMTVLFILFYIVGNIAFIEGFAKMVKNWKGLRRR